MRHESADTGLPPTTGTPGPLPIELFFAQVGSDPFRDAFGASQPARPFVGMTPVPESAVPALWDSLRRTPRSAPSVAYVHVPFCASRCATCGFYQQRWKLEDSQSYVDALVIQLEREREQPYQAAGPIRALYFGGSTPTLLAAGELARAIGAVRKRLPLTADCEITVEGRVYGFGPNAAHAAFDAGANRLSLGVQSFDTAVRRRMGRRCDGNEVVKRLEALLALDRGTIVIDLIYGLPGQTQAIWADDVRQAIALGLNGLDLYALQSMRDTPPAGGDKRSGVSALSAIPAGQHGAYFLRGAELLEAARWESLSCSHWRHGTRERNSFNLLTKSGASCVAVGAGAGGVLAAPDGTGYAYRNRPDVAGYRTCCRTGAFWVADLMRHPPHQQLFDCIQGGLERGRLDLGTVAWQLRKHADLDLAEIAGPLFCQWEDAGLLVQDGGWLDLTLAGRFWQGRLTQNLLRWLTQALDGADG